MFCVLVFAHDSTRNGPAGYWVRIEACGWRANPDHSASKRVSMYEKMGIVKCAWNGHTTMSCTASDVYGICMHRISMHPFTNRALDKRPLSWADLVCMILYQSQDAATPAAVKPIPIQSHPIHDMKQKGTAAFGPVHCNCRET